MVVQGLNGLQQSIYGHNIIECKYVYLLDTDCSIIVNCSLLLTESNALQFTIYSIVNDPKGFQYTN